ncbi:MAG: hypothetical protein JXA54_16190 [Candidatus Heimdallarchaeota archaeon]|nr:hypothetical protein [Candidatus Heimdallarchaeota archaeon]
MSQSDSKVDEMNAITELEENLQHAIDDLIEESSNNSQQINAHVSMIITHLAIAAASLRMKKQQEILKVKSYYILK